MFMNICDFKKLFIINHKCGCLCVWWTSQPAIVAVSAARTKTNMVVSIRTPRYVSVIDASVKEYVHNFLVKQ